MLVSEIIIILYCWWKRF